MALTISSRYAVASVYDPTASASSLMMSPGNIGRSSDVSCDSGIGNTPGKRDVRVAHKDCHAFWRETLVEKGIVCGRKPPAIAGQMLEEALAVSGKGIGPLLTMLRRHLDLNTSRVPVAEAKAMRCTADRRFGRIGDGNLRVRQRRHGQPFFASSAVGTCIHYG
jgi:hypothetical protein